MVNTLAPKWTPLGLFQRARLFVHSPADAVLLVHAAVFLAVAPALLRRGDLRGALTALRRTQRGRARAPRASYESICRVRGLWLRQRCFASRNTCYARALTLFRFLDAPDDAVGIHFGIERRRQGEERLRGHAWVTLHGVLLEGPQALNEGTIEEIPIFSKAAT